MPWIGMTLASAASVSMWPRMRFRKSIWPDATSRRAISTPSARERPWSQSSSATMRMPTMKSGPMRPRIASSTRKVKRSRLSSRSEEHTSELQSLMRLSYAVFRLKKKRTVTALLYYNMTIYIQVVTLHNESHTQHDTQLLINMKHHIYARIRLSLMNDIHTQRHNDHTDKTYDSNLMYYSTS